MIAFHKGFPPCDVPSWRQHEHAAWQPTEVQLWLTIALDSVSSRVSPRFDAVDARSRLGGGDTRIIAWCRN